MVKVKNYHSLGKYHGEVEYTYLYTVVSVVFLREYCDLFASRVWNPVVIGSIQWTSSCANAQLGTKTEDYGGNRLEGEENSYINCGSEYAVVIC